MAENKDVVLERLQQAVGKAHVKTDPETLAFYAEDQSFAPRVRPSYAVFPKDQAEVQALLKLAGELRVPVVPRSSAVSLHGASIPAEGGILVDLRRMDRIVEIDERNWYAIIEPGVTFLQLGAELHRRGFRVAAPLLDPPSLSVVSSYMERNPVTTAADFTFGTEHVISYTVVAPSGDPFTIGHPPLANAPAGAPDGPGLNFYRIFQGAEGTLGIVTRMILRVLPLPGAEKLFFFACEDIERAVEIIRRLQKSELGLECFALNDFNLAALLVEEPADRSALLAKGAYVGQRGAAPWDEATAEAFSELRRRLPPWTVVIALSAVGPIPEEKVAYQEIDLREAATEIGAEPRPTVGGIAALSRVISEELRQPSRLQKRFGFRGSCHPLMFASPPDRVAEFDEAVAWVADQFSYPKDEIGGFLLPLERGRGFYLAYDLHSSPEDPDETAEVSDLFDALGEALVDAGAFFDRPYGKWAPLVFGRAGTYTEYLKKLKQELDPHRIMNPGKLCF